MEVLNKGKDRYDIISYLDRSSAKFFLSHLKKFIPKYEKLSHDYPSGNKLVIHCSVQPSPEMEVSGWSSRVIESNGKIMEVLFLDYDSILYRLVKKELKAVMQEWNLTPFYVFSTYETKDRHGEKYGNYFAVCLTKLRYKDVFRIMDSLHIDPSYKMIARIHRFRTWVMRLTGKGKKDSPKFKEVIGNDNSFYYQNISKAHLQLLRNMFKVPDINYKNLDKGELKDLTFVRYKTASK